jgi:uncharacterized membrane protein YdjX (TVP38/TMEM64 family)
MTEAPEDARAPSGLRSVLRLTWIFFVIALLLALPFFVVGDRLEAMLHQDRLVAWFQSYRASAWLVGTGLLVSDLVLPIPNTMVMAALGVIYGPVLGGLVSTLGNCLSGLLGYWLCRSYGRPVAARLIGEADLEAGHRLFARSGGLIVALSRWLPVLPEIVSCMAGLTRMPFRVFVLALFAGSAPLGFVVAGLGYAGSEQPILTLVLCALLPLPLWYLLQSIVVPRASTEAEAPVERR